MTEYSLESVEITRVVRDVRRRWRLGRGIRGVAITLGGSVIALAVAAAVMGAFDYSDAAVGAARISVAVVVALLAGRFVVVPLLPRPRDAQVALYLEEREPSLEGSLVTAVEASGGAAAAGSPTSPALLARLMHAARARARLVADGRDADAPVLRTAWMTLGAVVLSAVFALAIAPDVLRQGMGLLLRPWAEVPTAVRFRIDVEPGDTELPRGGDLLVRAALQGFDSDRADVLVRVSDSTDWLPVPMSGEKRQRFSARLFDVTAGSEYVVEAAGVRSPVYRIVVSDLPAARRLDLEYRFPAYTRRPPERVDSGGDIAALRGTMVRVRVHPTIPAQGGRLLLDNGRAIPLQVQPDSSLTGTIRLDRTGFYKVELRARDGRMVAGSLEYAIDVLPDRGPAVKIVKPGRDQKVLSVDEVFTEARAEDDYGIATLDLVYSVNGGPERVVPLSAGATRTLKEIAAGHTFMLEEFALQVGDVVSYYARATDNDAVSGGKLASSDIYFLQVRPYAQAYRQNQGGGGAGAQGGGEAPSQLSQQQREIIAATFKTMRDSSATARDELAGNLATLRLSQEKLREQVRELGTRLVQRGVAARDSGFRVIADILPRAAAAMDTAARTLAAARLRDALQPEQRALQQLQRAEAVFREIQVQMGSESQGGAGGGASPAQDLADLFELEKDRLRNQFESVQRGQQDGVEQQAQRAQVDELAEKLKQLAARQQQEDERARRKADSLGQRGASGASGGQVQRQMAEDAESVARQLERLAREQRSQPLADAARRMQDAADAMRRSATGSAADRAAAADRLREAQRLLEQERGNELQRGLRDAAAAARGLAERQREVDSELGRMAAAGDAARMESQQKVGEKSGAMADQVRTLGQKLDRMAMENRRSSPAAARQVEEAADTMRGRHLEDKLRVAQMNARFVPPEYLRQLGRSIAADIDDLANRLDRAAASTSGRGAPERDGREVTLERARDLVRALESLDERILQRQGQGHPGRPGPQGRPTLSRQDAQQFRRELQERIREAESMRGSLERQGQDVTELARAIQGMRSLGTPAGLDDPRSAADLRAQTIEGLKAFEFALRRRLGGADPGVLLGRAGDVPARYRQQVEEYYRSLGRDGRP